MGFEAALIESIDPVLAQRFVVVFCSFITWSVMFLVVFSRPASQRLMEKVRAGKGPRLERQELANRACAFVHSVVVSAGAINLALFRESPIKVQNIWDHRTWPSFFAYSPDMMFYACFSSGFFIADLILVTILLEENGVAFFVHALVGLFAGMYIIFTGWAMPYYAMLLLVECSTPFLHIRWFLLEYGYKGSVYEVINGLCLVFVFTVARNILCNIVCIKLVYELHTSLKDKVTVFTLVSFSLCAVSMMTLNTIWGFALWKGFIRTLFKMIKGGAAAAPKPAGKAE